MSNHAQHLVHQMRTLFESMDTSAIARDVDRDGLDNYINGCALLAAATGAGAGLGGPVTLIVGLPISVINTMTQQFRVTMAVIHSKCGTMKVSFGGFMKIVAMSLGVNAGVFGIGNALLTAVAAQILVRLGVTGIGGLIPVVGAFIGGGTNYAYIHAIAASLKGLDVCNID